MVGIEPGALMGPEEPQFSLHTRNLISTVKSLRLICG
jgi:hypothetical protein